MAASGASRASSSCSNGLPSAKRPLIFALPPPRRKNAAAARPANKSGIRAGATSVTSPSMRRSVTRGVPISRPTACSASSSRPPGSTKVLVPPPSAASRRKKPSFTAVSMPIVNTRASPSSDCSRLSTLDSSPTCPSVSSTTTGARAALSPRPRSCWSACRMARSSSVPPRDSTDRSHFSPRSIAPSSACWNPPGIHSTTSSNACSENRSRGPSVLRARQVGVPAEQLNLDAQRHLRIETGREPGRRDPRCVRDRARIGDDAVARLLAWKLLPSHVSRCDDQRQAQLGAPVLEEGQALAVRQADHDRVARLHVAHLHREHVVALLLEQRGALALVEGLRVLAARLRALLDAAAHHALAVLHLEPAHRAAAREREDVDRLDGFLERVAELLLDRHFGDAVDHARAELDALERQGLLLRLQRAQGAGHAGRDVHHGDRQRHRSPPSAAKAARILASSAAGSRGRQPSSTTRRTPGSTATSRSRSEGT